jgi:hypothetical protein
MSTSWRDAPDAAEAHKGEDEDGSPVDEDRAVGDMGEGVEATLPDEDEPGAM